MTPEGRVKAKLKKFLAGANLYVYWPVPAGYGATTVDCLIWGKFKNADYPEGRFESWAVECKREGVEEPTPRQATVMRQMRKHGVKTYVVTMADGELVWLEQKDEASAARPAGASGLP